MPSVPHAVAVLDLETTGLGPSDRILEIGVVLLDRELRQEATWQTLVQPGRDIDNSHIHGVTATDLVHAPTFAGVAAELAELLDGRVIVAHNAPFDIRFLAAEYARLGVELPAGTRWFQCTRVLSRRLLPGAPQRLADCLDTAGLGNDRPHAALADAAAAADLYRALSNSCTQHLRERRKLEYVDVTALRDLQSEDFAPADFEQEQALIARLLAALPDEQSEVIRLHLHGECTFADIAEILDIPLPTAKSRYRYGIEHLRKELQKQNLF